MPLTNTVDIYRYSDELLKHMLKDVFETIENDLLLYSKKKVVIYGNNNDRRAYHTKTGGNRTDENLTERIQKLQNQLKNEHVYRIPLKYLCDIVWSIRFNQIHFKFNTKYILTLETDI